MMRALLGFTFVELLVVIIVMGIITVAMIPHLNTDAFQTQLLTDELVSTLQLARERAIASGCTVRVAQDSNTKLLDVYYYVPCNSNSNQSVQLIYRAGQIDSVAQGGSSGTGSTISVPSSIQVTLTPAAFYFNALGQVYQEGALPNTNTRFASVSVSGSTPAGPSGTNISINSLGLVSFASTGAL